MISSTIWNKLALVNFSKTNRKVTGALEEKVPKATLDYCCSYRTTNLNNQLELSHHIGTFSGAHFIFQATGRIFA